MSASTPAKAKRPTWGFLNNFKKAGVLRSRRWACFEAMKRAAPLEPTRLRYLKLLKRWDDRLREFGGDPSVLDWEQYRPLRLRREEDWSDWLGWLFETSCTGEFAQRLFGDHFNFSQLPPHHPAVVREEPTEDRERRGDILLLWRPRLGINLEVKLGNKRFGKTFETGHKLRDQHKQEALEWRNLVVLPTESLTQWTDTVRREGHEVREVPVILWEEVALALRRCLWSKREPVAWRAWAWTFCGAIELRLLRLRRQTGERLSFVRFSTMVSWVGLLERGSRS